MDLGRCRRCCAEDVADDDYDEAGYVKVNVKMMLMMVTTRVIGNILMMMMST
jgi:hypothetical protein